MDKLEEKIREFLELIGEPVPKEHTLDMFVAMIKAADEEKSTIKRLNDKMEYINNNL